MQYSFIINPHARSGQAQATWSQLKNYLDTNNIEYHSDFTRYPGHATEIASQFANQLSQDMVIIAVGGDGTVDEVINGLYNREHPKNVNQIPIAIIPAGWQNQFAKALGIQAQPVDAFQQILVASEPTTINIGHYHESIKDEDGYFINTWGLGFDAALLSHRNGLKKGQRKMGPLSFMRNAGSILYNQQPYSLMVQEKQRHSLYANTFISTCFNFLPEGSRQQRYQSLLKPELSLLIIERRNWLITFWTLCLLITGHITKSRWAHFITAKQFHYTTSSLEFVQKDGIELGNRFVDVTMESVPCHIWQSNSASVKSIDKNN
ncbi:MAG TPA: diacylglycerol kinase [Limosilactobacillus coleohominis]|nr:diacylglycerol kinase [Limosilactobacillus coleohominis]